MNNRYTLPIAVAAAAHTALLLGFRHSAGTPPAGAPTAVLPAEVIRVERFEERIDPPETASESQALANNDRSKLEEPVERPDPGPVTMVARPTPYVRSTNPTLEIPTIGGPDGAKFATGTPGVFSSAHLDKSPNAQVQATPDYPFSAKREGLDGNVVVEFLVDETGRVSDPRVVSSSNQVFEEPSLRAVMKWRFEPGRREGKVVRFKMAVPLVFRLNNN